MAASSRLTLAAASPPAPPASACRPGSQPQPQWPPGEEGRCGGRIVHGQMKALGGDILHQWWDAAEQLLPSPPPAPPGGCAGCSAWWRGCRGWASCQRRGGAGLRYRGGEGAGSRSGVAEQALGENARGASASVSPRCRNVEAEVVKRWQAKKAARPPGCSTRRCRRACCAARHTRQPGKLGLRCRQCSPFARLQHTQTQVLLCKTAHQSSQPS